MLDLLPEQMRVGVYEALRSTLSDAAVETLEPVAGGASGALTGRVTHRGRHYLVRVDIARGAFRNPVQYDCMKLAAAQGIAPALHFVDGAQGIAIMDLIECRPLATFRGGQGALVCAAGALIAQLQAGPCFPPFIAYPDAIGRMLAVLNTPEVFCAGLLEPHLAGFESIRNACPWGGAPDVASHNDPNPRNILYDGNRLWLIDWETAYGGHGLIDVAVVAENWAVTAEDEAMLLDAWRPGTSGPEWSARLYLMRLLTRLYYAGIILAPLSIERRSPPIADLSSMTSAEFGVAFANGNFVPGAPESMFEFGKMFLAGFVEATRTPRFREALATLGRT
jgi:hypothetical protein